MKKWEVFYWVLLVLVGTILVVIGNLGIVNEVFGYIGAGFLGASLVKLFKLYRISKNEELKKKIEVESNDERNIAIAHKAGFLSMRYSLLIICIVEFILFAMGYFEAGYALSGVVCLNLIFYFVLYYYFKLKN